MFLIKFSILLLLKCSFLACIHYDFNLTNSYNHKLSKLLYVLSIDGYSSYAGICIPKLIPIFSSYFCYKSVNIKCDRKGNKCRLYTLINIHTGKIIIVFGGTMGVSQFYKEGESLLKRKKNFYNIGLINSYFYETHHYLWEEIKELFEHPLYRKFKVIVTGHSLGGAFAALIALRIQLEGYVFSRKLFLYTFGEPRVGTRAFAINFDRKISNSWRVVFATDFVPHIPTCKKLKRTNYRFRLKKESLPCDPYYFNGYYHHGTEIWYPNRGNYKHFYRVCLGFPPNEDFNCSDQILFRKHKYHLHRGDHSDYFKEVTFEFANIYYEKYDENCMTTDNSK